MADQRRIMLRIAFEPEAVEELKYERMRHPHPRVQQKMWTLWLKSLGFSHQDVCRSVGITENTLRAYLREYASGGIEALRVVPFEGPQSQLDAHQTTIEAYFREHPPASSAEARVAIAKLTGIERSPTQIRAFMHRMGMNFRKVAAVPAKVNPVTQEEFKKKSWNPGLRKQNLGHARSIS
jgi:transposase